MIGRGHFIAGVWTLGEGAQFASVDPSTGNSVWEGQEASPKQVDAAIAAARSALLFWSRLTVSERTGYLTSFADKVKENRAVLADAISQETGKPLWESLQECDTMVAKVANSIEAYRDRCSESEFSQADFRAVKRFRPHGVVAVLGPFNLPGHLPHSHIVPALLAGNTVVFKPSEMTPGVSEWTTAFWQQAGLPAGVLNLVQGGRNTGVSLASHPGLDGLFFTGSHAGGVALARQFSEHPGKILALELGGNNPLVIWDCAEAQQAALLTAQSAFITAGQRCVCARRLILPEGTDGDRHLRALLSLVPRLRVGAYGDRPEPFLGPVISIQAADHLMDAQSKLEKLGGTILVRMRRMQHAFLSPGIVDMTGVENCPDEEYFGPLLQIIRVKDFDAAIDVANQTRFGLAAGLLSDRLDRWELFRNRIRAGVVNWNRQTTGASGKLPFGGVGDSGNHRPSAYYAADYCAYPVASLEAAPLAKPDGSGIQPLPLGIDP